MDLLDLATARTVRQLSSPSTHTTPRPSLKKILLLSHRVSSMPSSYIYILICCRKGRTLRNIASPLNPFNYLSVAIRGPPVF
ncbi:hypothetical protein CEXT_353381 [Caerostris extrusa]|uniref:Uncharacterized protein n=1 Tax=Caerostris extrusa TaxID=172846 RepID=A0AAV4YB13_CAEEX|nr:hypothetical protein CEXT_353381 [Caerostris extrusa]